MLSVTVRNDQRNTIERHLDYTSPRIAVDNLFRLNLKTAGFSYSDRVHISTLNRSTVQPPTCGKSQFPVVGAARCSLFPEHPVNLTSMSPPCSRCRAFLWRSPAQPTRICHCAPPRRFCRTCTQRLTSPPCGLHQITTDADTWEVWPKKRFSGHAHYFWYGRRHRRGGGDASPGS